MSVAPGPPGPEQARLADPGWRRWGPYLAERAWGTVREDYSADGDAWNAFSHDQARSRAYRWSEDGLGGVCDESQHLCLAFAFWNGADPILKERIFGLTGDEGNHGEDAKEYWWYLDSTPTHSWMRWAYVYPQRAFPYADLVDTNARRDRTQPEYELLDTGCFADDRYFEIVATYAKATPDDLLITLAVTNHGPDAAPLHVLPHLWFRNRWTWEPDHPRPRIEATPAGGLMATGDPELSPMWLIGESAAGCAAPRPLFCENETNVERLYGAAPGVGPRYPKDGIGDHVLSGGRADTVNPAGHGTKAALWFELEVPAGETREIRLRLCAESRDSLGPDAEDVMAARETEADAFYADRLAGVDPEARDIARQALAGMLWSKQFYHYDVGRWLDGDPGQPVPPAARLSGRNHRWRHLAGHDVISMPDPWEYPWFAAWDLAFHTIALAHVDPGFAKAQLRLLTREWYMHPSGMLPAYEWNFEDVNPPVHAIAALAVYEIDGGWDRDWLARIFHKLLLNVTWWANMKDPTGTNLFGGGFLGMDNVGPFDRSRPLPDGLTLEQADGTGWMALFCLSMLEIALILARHDPAYEDVAITFFEHFTLIAEAINERGLWDESDGFYYDRVSDAAGSSRPVRVRSMTGLIPLCAVATGTAADVQGLEEFNRRVADYLTGHPAVSAYAHPGAEPGSLLLSLVSREQLPRILQRLSDPEEFLAPHGLRALSAAYRGRPFEFRVDGETPASVDYEPAESTTPLFGGNSNWRGPIWFPVNYLVLGALRRFGDHLEPGVTFEFPVGSGQRRSPAEIAAALADRLVSIYRVGPDGRRPVFGSYPGMPAAWSDRLPFHEYFHGDTGAGLGASHQTGWTGLVADLIIRGAARHPGGAGSAPDASDPSPA